MKRFAILMLTMALVYLSSCSNNDNINLTTRPQLDSVSKGSTVNISYTVGFTPKTFAMTDLVVNNSAIYSMTENVYNIAPDSFWYTTITLTDHTRQKISFNLTFERDSTTELGVYAVNTNTCTLTDFSAGSNSVYSVLQGSTFNLTAINSHFITGTLNLLLYSDHDTTVATGNLQIYH